MSSAEMGCPFGLPTESLSGCPKQRRCHCVLDLLLHVLGHVDRQTSAVTAYWQENTVFDDNLDRTLLPEYEEYDDG